MSLHYCTVLLLMSVMSDRRRNARRRARRRLLTGSPRSGRRLAISQIAWPPLPRVLPLLRDLCHILAPNTSVLRWKFGKLLGRHPPAPSPPHFCVTYCLCRGGTAFYRRPPLARACSRGPASYSLTPSPSLNSFCSRCIQCHPRCNRQHHRMRQWQALNCCSREPGPPVTPRPRARPPARPPDRRARPRSRGVGEDCFPRTAFPY